jgi:hypothetical protein
MTSRCHDTLRGDRCERPSGHDGMHRHGTHTWDFRDVPRSPWMDHLRAKELVR